MAVNDELADNDILRSVRAMRAGNGVWRDLLPILRKLEREIIDELEKGVPRTLAAKRAERLLVRVREIINEGAEGFERRLEAAGIQLAEIEERGAFRSLNRTVPVDIDWVRPSERLLLAVAIAEPFDGALLKDHVSEWSRNTVFRMQSELRTGIIAGEGIEPLRRRIETVAALKTSQARSIARTYVMHVTNAARAKLYEENRDVIASEQWVATLDDRTCLRCAVLDNKTFPPGKGSQPPLHINCRCVRVPITRSAKALADRGIISTRTARGANGLTGEVPENMNFSEWLRRQPPAVQKEVLGAKRFELYQSGVNIDKFVNDEGFIINLDDL